MYRSIRKMLVSRGTGPNSKNVDLPSQKEMEKREKEKKEDIPVAHSVCPLLFLTPPTAYLNVTICPGLVKSLSSLLGSASNRAV